MTLRHSGQLIDSSSRDSYLGVFADAVYPCTSTFFHNDAMSQV